MDLRRGGIAYTNADDVKALVEDIVKFLSDFFWYIDCSRLYVVRSKNSKSKAIARIHALPKIWRYTLRIPPQYIIEVISEKFDSLDFEEKVYVLIHELLHIPIGFSGGLRPHKNYVTDSKIRRLLKIYLARKNHDSKDF
ncbi:MAG: putative metallopeptidase [Ignisphaera sp.]